MPAVLAPQPAPQPLERACTFVGIRGEGQSRLDAGRPIARVAYTYLAVRTTTLRGWATQPLFEVGRLPSELETGNLREPGAAGSGRSLQHPLPIV
jgi:hypothetical protein